MFYLLEEWETVLSQHNKFPWHQNLQLSMAFAQDAQWWNTEGKTKDVMWMFTIGQALPFCLDQINQ